jgi:AcrR family transcriptional regulator
MLTSASTTKERLLAAARMEFAAHGIAGARIDRIANLAGANKERIYGYFGSKERLFDEVVVDALDELLDAVPLRPGDDAVDYVGRLFDFHADHPELLRLLLWEALHYRAHPLPGEDGRAARYRRKVILFAAALGVDPGDGEDAAFETGASLLTVIGLAAWPNAVPQMARLIIGAPANADATRHDMRAFLMDFARRALVRRD